MSWKLTEEEEFNSASNVSILLVEDDDDLRENIHKYLEMEGFRVIVARDGREAMQKARLQQFSLILSDIRMPKMAGDDAIHEIKQMDTNKKTPIVILSGHIDKKVVDKVKSHICKAFIKPVDVKEIVSFIKSYFRL